MTPPSPVRTPSYRQGTPPPPSFHSPTHTSPTRNPNPNSNSNSNSSSTPTAATGPNSLRRVVGNGVLDNGSVGAGIGTNVSSTAGSTAPPLSVKSVSASPFTQINAEYAETMQQLGRTPGSASSTIPPLPTRALSPVALNAINLSSPLERRNSTSSKRSSISPRQSLKASTSVTSLTEQLKSFELTRHTPPPRLHSPLIQSPLHESHSPKRRTPDRSLPLNEEHEEQQQQDYQDGAEYDSPHDAKLLPNSAGEEEEGDTTIRPTRRTSGVDRITAGAGGPSPQPNAFPTQQKLSRSRERLQERYQRSLEAATKETPLRRPDSLSEPEDSEKSEYEGELHGSLHEMENSIIGDSSSDGPSTTAINGRESRAGHRRSDEDDSQNPLDPAGGTLRTIAEVGDGEEETLENMISKTTAAATSGGVLSSSSGGATVLKAGHSHSHLHSGHIHHSARAVVQVDDVVNQEGHGIAQGDELHLQEGGVGVEDEDEDEGQFTPRSPAAALLDSPVIQEATQLAASRILAQLFPPRISQLRRQEQQQQQQSQQQQQASLHQQLQQLQLQNQQSPQPHSQPHSHLHSHPPSQHAHSPQQPPRPRTSSNASTTSQRPSIPIRHHIPDVAVPLASSHWNPGMAFDPGDVNRLLQDLQRNISPIANSRYSRARVGAQSPPVQVGHPLQQSFGRPGSESPSPPPSAAAASASGTHQGQENAGRGRVIDQAYLDALTSDPRGAMMIGTPSGIPDDVLQSFVGENGYYGYTMGMVSPAPSSIVMGGMGTGVGGVGVGGLDQSLMEAQNVAGNSLAAMANAIAVSSTGRVGSPGPVHRGNDGVNSRTSPRRAGRGSSHQQQQQQDVQSEVTNENDRERPGAPIPPTPYTSQAATGATPAPLHSHHLAPDESLMANYPYHGLLSPQTHPVPYAHMRRNQTFPIQPLHHPQMIRGMSYPGQHQYQSFQGGPILTDSTFSPAATPYPHPVYPFNPFIQQNLQAARAGERTNIPVPAHLLETMSIRSSPSHLPVILPFDGSGPRRLRRKSKLNQQANQQQQQHDEGFSTEPLETTPEPTEAGDATDCGHTVQSSLIGSSNLPTFHSLSNKGPTQVEEPPLIDLLNDREDSTPIGVAIGGEEEEEGEWVNEDEPESDLLGLEYHPNYIPNPDRRRKKWEQKWEVMKDAFQALDRETDSTMVLLASPSHTNTLHALSSRALRRSPAPMLSSEMAEVRNNFAKVATSRRIARLHSSASLLERLRKQAGSTGSSSPGNSSEAREEELRTLLEGALGSLSQVGKMYSDLQTRWQAEMARLGEERESIQILLEQAFGVGVASTLYNVQTNMNMHGGMV